MRRSKRAGRPFYTWPGRPCYTWAGRPCYVAVIKNLSALAVVISAKASGGVLRSSARHAATCATLAGSLVFILRTGSGERYGASVSIRMRSSGTSMAARRRSSEFLNVTIPEKLIMAPISRAARPVGAFGKRVKDDGRAIHAGCAEDGHGVVKRLASVDDDSLAQPPGQVKVLREDVSLGGRREKL